jgi:hypothetical protein
VPWQEAFLSQRVNIYTETGHPKAAQAREDLRVFRNDKKQQLLFDYGPKPNTGNSPE